MAFFNNTLAHDSQLRRKKSITSLHPEKIFNVKSPVDTRRSVEERKSTSSRPSPIDVGDVPTLPWMSDENKERQQHRPSLDSSSVSGMAAKRTKRDSLTSPAANLIIHVPLLNNGYDTTDHDHPATRSSTENSYSGVKRPVTSPSRLPSTSSPSRLIDSQSRGRTGPDMTFANPRPSGVQFGSPAMYGRPSSRLVGQGGGRGSAPASPLPIGPGLGQTLSNTAPSSPSSSLPAGFFPPGPSSSPTARSFTSAHSSPVRRVPVPAYEPNPNELSVTASGSASVNAPTSRSTSALGYATGSASRSGSTSNLSHSAEGEYQGGPHQSSLQKKARNLLKKPSLTRRQGLQQPQQSQHPSGNEPMAPTVDTATAAAIATAVAVVDATGGGHTNKEKERAKANRTRSKSALLSRSLKSSKDKDRNDNHSNVLGLPHNTRVEPTHEVVVPTSPQAQGETPLTPAREVVMAYYQQAEMKKEQQELKVETREATTLNPNLNAVASAEVNDNDPAADITATDATTATTPKTTKIAATSTDAPHDAPAPQQQSQNTLSSQPSVNLLTSTTGKLIALGSPADSKVLDSDRLSLSRLSYTRHSDASSTRSFNVGASATSKETRSGSRSWKGNFGREDPTENFAVGGKSTWVPPWGSEHVFDKDKDRDKSVVKGRASVDKDRERVIIARRPSTAGAALGGTSSTGASAAPTKEGPNQSQGSFKTLSRKLSARLIPTLPQLTQQAQVSSHTGRKASLPYAPTPVQSELLSQTQTQSQDKKHSMSARPRHTYSHSQGHVGKRSSISGALDFFTAGLSQTSSIGRVPAPGTVAAPKTTALISSPTASATHYSRPPQSVRLPPTDGWLSHREDVADESKGIHANLGMGSYVDGRRDKKQDGEMAEVGKGRVWEDSVGDWVMRQKWELQKNKDDRLQSHGESALANSNAVSVSSPNSPTSSLSNSKRLWRLVKRFSSGNLKEKKAAAGGKGEMEKVPPVPPLPKGVHLKEKSQEKLHDEWESPTSPKAIMINPASIPSSTNVQAPRRWRSATATTGTSSSPSTASGTTSGMFPRSRSSSAAGSESSYGEDVMVIPPVPVPELPLLHQKGQLQGGGEPREGKSEDDGRTMLGAGGVVLRRRTPSSSKVGGRGGDGPGNNSGEGLPPSPAGSATIPAFDSTSPVNAFAMAGRRKTSSNKTSRSNSSTSTQRGQAEPPSTAAWPGSDHQTKSQRQPSPPVPPRSPHRVSSKKQPIPETSTGTSGVEAQTRRPSGASDVRTRPGAKAAAARPRSMSEGDIAAEQERQLQSQRQDDPVAAYPLRRSGDTQRATNTVTPSRSARTESPGPSFMFRELSSASARETLTEQEKTAKWEDLLRKSAKAGGTLHVVDASISGRKRARRRSHDSGGLGVNLWSDERSSMRTSLAISETSSLAGDLAG